MAIRKQAFRIGKLSEALDAGKVPLSPVVRAGDFVFVSGQPPVDQRTGKLIKGDVAAQTAQSLENVKLCLETAGSSLDQVVKCTVYITNAAYFATVNKVYARYFPRNRPARTFCVVGSWPIPFDIEIECIAIANAPPRTAAARRGKGRRPAGKIAGRARKA
ncbi:MAG: RidA family protein [Alphaproteobacteria bacterium]|nr:RidA family protein [Alphaproteobacteria bacterium]